MSLSARARSSASEGGCFCWAGNEEAGKRPKRAGTAARIEMAEHLRMIQRFRLDWEGWGSGCKTIVTAIPLLRSGRKDSGFRLVFESGLNFSGSSAVYNG